MKKPIKFVGAFLLPGNPIRFDISWSIRPGPRYYLAESGKRRCRTVFDAENNLFRQDSGIPRFGGCGRPVRDELKEWEPNGVLVTPDNHLWATTRTAR